MGREMVTHPRDSGASSVVALGLRDVEEMGTRFSLLGDEDRRRASEAACQDWGLAGVGWRRGDTWAGAILVTPGRGLPRGHPLVAGGLDDSTAGVMAIYLDPAWSSVVLGKRLCVGLCRMLRGQVSGIEAQAGLRGPVRSSLAPSPRWLALMGFQALRYPIGRYRIDFDSLAVWILRRLQIYPRPVVGYAASSSGRRVG